MKESLCNPNICICNKETSVNQYARSKEILCIQGRAIFVHVLKAQPIQRKSLLGDFSLWKVKVRIFICSFHVLAPTNELFIQTTFSYSKLCFELSLSPSWYFVALMVTRCPFKSLSFNINFINWKDLSVSWNPYKQFEISQQMWILTILIIGLNVLWHLRCQCLYN